MSRAARGISEPKNPINAPRASDGTAATPASNLPPSMTRSESRALLDEQIADLKSLRDAADYVYVMAAGIPAAARRGLEPLASLLADTVVDGRRKLEESLERAKHWLGKTQPVYVPVPTGEGDRASACEGASELVVMLAILAGIDADSPVTPPVNAAQLKDMLAAKWRRDGITSWVFSAPTEELLRLADVVKQEINAAIALATREFRNANIGPVMQEKPVKPKSDGAKGRRRKAKNRQPRPLTDKQLEAVEMVNELHGNLTAAAAKLRISRAALTKSYNAGMEKLKQSSVKPKLKKQALPTDRRGQATVETPRN